MYKVIKDNKIIGISEDYPKLLDSYEVVEDTEHSCDDYEEYNGEYLLKKDIPAPTKEEQEELRAEAYKVEVDPITCHINRLKDKEQTAEIQEEIATLQAERESKVNDIKQRYPYPTEE